MPVAGADRLVLDRAYRGHGPDGARRRAAAAGGRSRAGHRAQEPAVRASTTRTCSRSPGERRASLRAALRAQGAGEDRVRATPRRRLDALRDAARTETPFGFYARAARGRAAAADAFSRGSATRPTTRSTNSSISRSTTSGARRRRCRASSPGCARRATEIKRDMEITRDEVRVMTVHGAKGLEAPIVILADTTTPPAGPRSVSRGSWRLPRRRRAGTPDRLSGRAARPTTSPAVAAARERVRRDDRGRISPPALCRDDARRRPADRLRRRGRAKRRRAAGTTWCAMRSTASVVDRDRDGEDGNVWRLPQGSPDATADRGRRAASARRRSSIFPPGSPRDAPPEPERGRGRCRRRPRSTKTAAPARREPARGEAQRRRRWRAAGSSTG